MEKNSNLYEEYRDKLLATPEAKAKYLIAKERVKLEMMLETLRTQIIEEKERKTILRQLSKISLRVSQMYL